MRSPILIALVLVALAVPLDAGAGSGRAPAEAAPAASADADLGLSRIDQVMIEIQELAEWMAKNRTRLELRDMNRSVEQSCERLQAMEQRTRMLAGDTELARHPKHGPVLVRLREQMTVLSDRMCGVFASIRNMAQHTGAPEPISAAERKQYRDRTAAVLHSLDALEAHSRQYHAWVADNPHHPELTNAARDVNEMRQLLRQTLVEMDRMSADAALDRARLREMAAIVQGFEVSVGALDAAQDCVATLAGKE